jgi:hypothetical protein
VFTMIEIAVLSENAEIVQAEIHRCCTETGDLFLGRRIDEATGEINLFVHLKYRVHLSHHLSVLDIALQRQLILSFLCATYNQMIFVMCDASYGVRGRLPKFPLNLGETWFLLVTDETEGYICTRRPLLSPQQSAWLIQQEIRWRYV